MVELDKHQIQVAIIIKLNIKQKNEALELST